MPTSRHYCSGLHSSRASGHAAASSERNLLFASQLVRDPRHSRGQNRGGIFESIGYPRPSRSSEFASATLLRGIHRRGFSNSNNNSGGGAKEVSTDAPLSAADKNAFAVATISPQEKGIQLEHMRIEHILKAAPGTFARDFFSLSLTNLGDAASRKGRPNHRKIDPWFILPRKSEIVMSFGCIRAIINRDTGMIFEAHKPMVKQHAQHIARGINRRDCFTMNDGKIVYHGNPTKGGQFELSMVEEILREVCTTFSRRVRLYKPIMHELMARITEEEASASSLHKLVPLKDSLQHFEMNVKGALRCLKDLLDSDEDMLNLMLTEKYEAKQRNEELPIKSHERVELLLEEYGRQLNSILLEIAYLLQRVQSKQDMVSLSLDSYRNRIIRMNLYLTMAGISLAFGTTIAGFFGMNLVNGLENHPTAFQFVVVSSTILGAGIMGACLSYIGGSRTRADTAETMRQLEIVERALSNMPALDYSLNTMAFEGETINREAFRKHIYASDPTNMRDSEIEFLFGLLDVSKDNKIDKNDFRPFET